MKKHPISFRRIGAIAAMSCYLALMAVGFQNCSAMKGFDARQFENSLSSTEGASSVDVDNDMDNPGSNNNNPTVDKTGFATLSWDANSETDLKEYRVYYGTSASNLSQVATKVGLTATPGAPELTINGLTKGTTYYFAVTAVNNSGQESDRSNVANKTP